MKPLMPTLGDENASNPLTGEQMALIEMDIRNGLTPEQAIAKHAALPDHYLMADVAKVGNAELTERLRQELYNHLQAKWSKIIG